jgi:hypothetical protein
LGVNQAQILKHFGESKICWKLFSEHCGVCWSGEKEEIQGIDQSVKVSLWIITCICKMYILKWPKKQKYFPFVDSG